MLIMSLDSCRGTLLLLYYCHYCCCS